jgi:hypothetical protein
MQNKRNCRLPLRKVHNTSKKLLLELVYKVHKKHKFE